MKQSIIVIAIPLEDDQLAPLHDWALKNDWSGIQTVHIIHVVKQVVSPLEFGNVEVPDETKFKEMTPSLETFLKEEGKKIIPADFDGQVFYHLEKSFSPEESINELIKNVKADLLVIGTRGKSGLEALFDHSISHYMLKHAPCDVYVVRPEAQA